MLTKQIDIGYYTEIEASNAGMEILYTQSDTGAGLSVVADRNILEKYNIRVIDGKLKIEPRKEYKQAWFKPTRFVVTTHSSSLNEVDLGGSITFTANTPLHTDHLTIDVSGSGKINFNDSLVVNELKMDLSGSGTLNAQALKGDFFRGRVSGSGKMNLGGSMAEASINIAGSGTIRAFDLEVDEMKCNIAGSGDIEIRVNNRIDADIAGSGRIKYKGNPSSIKQNVAGSGSIRQME